MRREVQTIAATCDDATQQQQHGLRSTWDTTYAPPPRRRRHCKITPSTCTDRPLFFSACLSPRVSAAFMRTIRTYMERDPIILFSCTIGLFGFVAPFVFGDGGRAKEEAQTSYAYRIKQVYPPS